VSFPRVPDAVTYAQGHTVGHANASVPRTLRGVRPWHVWTLLAPIALFAHPTVALSARVRFVSLELANKCWHKHYGSEKDSEGACVALLWLVEGRKTFRWGSLCKQARPSRRVCRRHSVRRLNKFNRNYEAYHGVNPSDPWRGDQQGLLAAIFAGRSERISR
jgi:hypothetical protein